MKPAVAFGDESGSLTGNVKEGSRLMKRRRYSGGHAVAFGLLAGLAGILVASGPVAAAVKVREIVTAEEAEKRVGQTVTVCGVVASARYADTTQTKMTYLNLGRTYPDQLMTVVIPNQLRALYRFRPEEYYKGKRICVAGTVTMYREKPQIIIDDPFDIRIDTPASSTAKQPAASTSE